MTTPRRPNDYWQDRVPLPIDHPSTAATLILKFHKCLLPFLVEKVDYVNPTGLVSDVTNFFDIELKNGATSIAKWTTATAAQGTIAAATFVTVPIPTPANTYPIANDVLSLVLTLHGAQTLPAGRLVVHGRYL